MLQQPQALAPGEVAERANRVRGRECPPRNTDLRAEPLKPRRGKPMVVSCMSVLVLVLATGLPLPACAQTVAPSDPLVVAIEYALGQRSGDWGRTLVVDTLRTARHSDDRAALVQDVALRLGARLGAIEDHCFLLPVDPAERAPLRRAEVRGASAVIAADVLSHAPDRARVRVTVWRGAGHHTGGTYELELRRDGAGGWEVARRITTATAGCIPRS